MNLFRYPTVGALSSYVLTVLTTRFATVAKFPSVSFAPVSRSLAENCFQNSADASEIHLLSELQTKLKFIDKRSFLIL